jgi:uncharacterized protein (TIGR04255 family)
VEAIFEARFTAKHDAAGDLLPGLLFAKLGSEYPKLEPTALASVPRQARAQDENLRYMASQQFSAETRKILVGDRAVVISQRVPYEGWNKFSTHIMNLMSILNGTNLIQTVERYSIKAINLLPEPEEKQLGLLNARFEIEGSRSPAKGFRFRTEVTAGDILMIIDIVTNAVVNIPGRNPIMGLLVSVDGLAVPKDTSEFWTTLKTRIDDLHKIVKRQFFGLLTDDAINELQPIWAESNELH